MNHATLQLDVRAATELNGHEKAVSSLDWDPVQPERLASAALDRTLKLWDIRCEFAIAFTSSFALFSPQSHESVTLNELVSFFSASFWDHSMQTSAHTATSSLEFQRGLLSTAFHPSGNYIATSDMEDTVTLVDTRMNKILGLILEAGRVPSNFVHDKKKQVLSNNNQSNEATSNIKGAGNRKGAKVVNPYLPLENKEELNKIKFSNDGSLFCMATSSGKVRMLDSRNLDFSHNSDQAETKQKQDQTMEVDKEPGEREKERNEWKDYIPWELAMDFRAHSANVFNLEFDNGGRLVLKGFKVHFRSLNLKREIDERRTKKKSELSLALSCSSSNFHGLFSSPWYLVTGIWSPHQLNRRLGSGTRKNSCLLHSIQTWKSLPET